MGRRPAFTVLLRRWLAVGAVVLVAFLYWRPIARYVDARSSLAERRAEVRALRREKAALVRRLAVSTSTDALAREARRLGFVEPGQHLYIVKGIPGWLRAHAASLRDHG
jgi:cell division protein FtsB